jgi:hypothetical protein
VHNSYLPVNKAKLSHPNDSSNTEITEDSKDKLAVELVAVPLAVVPTTAVLCVQDP